MSQVKIHDISPLISSQTAVWPGDTPFQREELCSFKQGQNLDLSTIKTTVHLGAHADAPNHYHPQGKGIDSRDVALYIGEAQVMRVSTKKGARIQVADLTSAVRSQRVLLVTGSYPDPEVFNEDFCSLSPELVRYLHEKGVRLVGIDTPSIDPFESKALESHNEVFKCNMAILEGLVLDHVPDGNHYWLVAPPLKIKDADASPVRALLLEGVRA